MDRSLLPISIVRGEAETAQKDGCSASKTAEFILGYLGSHASYATHIHRFSDTSVTYLLPFAEHLSPSNKISQNRWHCGMNSRQAPQMV
ncbi:hypothetical protein [Bradyrhizobium prioriisuperbiae]|uniref:hypothetical protein n=1 Tax=Bradyrhizobium prioriisuperbiae TaxID=2854389 RepID=UPI0028E5643E|nr:hypothetical protein [Bradyrhizobium prioritasuperba]